MIDDKIQDTTVRNACHTVSHYLSPSPCEITYSFKQSAQKYIILRKRKRGCPIFLLSQSLLAFISCAIAMQLEFLKREEKSSNYENTDVS